MERQLNGQINGWIDRHLVEQTNGLIDKRMDDENEILVGQGYSWLLLVLNYVFLAEDSTSFISPIQVVAPLLGF